VEQRDYLKRQIDQLGQVLGKILADLLGLKSKGQTTEAIEISGQILKNELGYDFDELLEIPAEDLIIDLQKNKKLNLENFNSLAEILLLIADDLNEEQPGNDKSKNLYNRCLIVYEFLNKADSTYSFERRLRIERLKALI